MAMRAEARAWWADVEDAHMRERIERRREADRTRAGGTRRRPRARPVERVGARPDKVARLAVALGFLLLAVAMLSSHA
jgi:hypothetical protein